MFRWINVQSQVLGSLTQATRTDWNSYEIDKTVHEKTNQKWIFKLKSYNNNLYNNCNFQVYHNRCLYQPNESFVLSVLINWDCLIRENHYEASHPRYNLSQTQAQPSTMCSGSIIQTRNKLHIEINDWSSIKLENAVRRNTNIKKLDSQQWFITWTKQSTVNRNIKRAGFI